MKPTQLLFLTVLASAICFLTPLCKASVAKGFVSSAGSSGDKCVACVSSRLYYCVGVATKTLDCYDNITDCQVLNSTATLTSYPLPKVNWYTSPLQCPKAVSKSECNIVISITGYFEATFTVSLDKNEWCGLYLINNIATGAA